MVRLQKSQSGVNGFGYDPIFLVDGYDNTTMADMSEEMKNSYLASQGIALKEND